MRLVPRRPRVDTPLPKPQADTLSVHRTFVVRLHTTFDPAGGSVSGLVEHVVSGSGGEFRSVEEMLRLMRLLLDAHEAGAEHSEESR
jgi:hypothetical protein